MTVYATENCIRVLDSQAKADQFGEKIFCEIKPESEGLKFTVVKVSADKIIVSQQNGIVKVYKLVITVDAGVTVAMNEVARIELGSEVSAICSYEEQEIHLIYVSLYDAPHFSLNILNLAATELQLLARMPLTSILETSQTKKFY